MEPARERIEVLALTDAALTVVKWTAAAERIWGYSVAEALNRSVEDLLVFPLKSLRAELSTASGPWSGSMRIKRRDGRKAQAEIQVSPVQSGDRENDLFVWSGKSAVSREMSPSVLNALFNCAPIGIAIWDRDLCCSWFNDSDTNEGVYRQDVELGGHITDLVATNHPVFLETAVRHVLERGVPLLDHELDPNPESPYDEQAHRFSVSFFRLDDAEGQAMGVCSLAVNVTHSRARQRLNMLSAAGMRIGTTLDPLNTAQELASAAVPILADYVTVDLAEVIALGQEPLNHLDSTDISVPVFYRAGARSIHEDMRESLWQRGEPVFVPPSSPFTAVLESRKSHFEPVLDTSPGTWLDNDPDRARVIRATGMHSLMVVPLQARGAMLGVAVFVRTENQAPFTLADLNLAEGLSDRAALSLDNALRYTRERQAALALQRDLLPHRLWGKGAVEVASRYLPSDTHGGVGGDWFDVISLPDDRVALVVGDVVGHGINAAAGMGRLRTVVHTLTNLGVPPAELLSRLDELVLEMTGESLDDTGFTSTAVGATCLYVIYDPHTLRCVMASAGHPPPAIVSPDGAVSFPDLRAGPPIGVGLMEFDSVEVELPEGSVIALYTDGLVETRGGDIDDGLARLRVALASPVAALDDLCGVVIDTMVATSPSEDDVALLLARTRSGADFQHTA